MQKMKQITDLKDLKGKTIAEIFQDEGKLIFEFTDDSWAMLQGNGDGEDAYLDIADPINTAFNQYFPLENAWRVRIGLKTQEDVERLSKRYGVKNVVLSDYKVK